jgi:hypothetical protein
VGPPDEQPWYWSPDRYGLLLIIIIAALLVGAVLGDSPAALAITLVIEVAAFAFALRTSTVRSDMTVAGVVIVAGAGLVALGLSAADHRGAATIVLGASSAAVAVASVVAVVRRVSRHLRIDIHTVLAALCIYLLLGLFFASVFLLVGATGGAFFASGHVGRGNDYLYFSFVTLTTTGYGDLTPGSDLARMLAVAEALTGQLYLVSVVALLVGNFGKSRAERAGGSPDQGS